MSTYLTHLPEVFPQFVQVEPELARKIIDRLTDSTRNDVPNGSSFAVTVDGPNGAWRVWMSEASFKYIDALLAANGGTL